ncbi:cell division protein CrgA [Leucobacter ruminantium]|uniref:Cell division protein CrgA n=1 Tax=Leucobacter ruminantium TaxID=1289170 RepID=A0A939RXS2_9MICO|nr:cell division protein CrgA [Leucobacter ruminantium]MBO1806452.1 cell division protein CrgA [Leucobacter ruminantium]
MAAPGKNLSKRKSAEVSKQDREAIAAARKEAPNPVWFKPVMFGFMLLGLLWIVLYYITSMNLQLPIPSLGQANIFIGFGLVLIGFLMTPWWK